MVIPVRPYKVTAQRVVDFFDKHKDMTSYEIAARLGLHPAYVRKALIRNGRTLKRTREMKGIRQRGGFIR